MKSLPQFQCLVSGLNEWMRKEGKTTYKYFVGNANGFYESNAVLSKFKILESSSEQIADDRCMVGLKIDHPHVQFLFLTHLDHVQEKKRMKQMKRGVKFMEEFMQEHHHQDENHASSQDEAIGNMSPQQQKTSNSNTAHPNDNTTNANYILMGDFNSMREDDYTPEFWNKIAKHRIEWGWEPAHTMIAEYLFEGKYSQHDDYDEFFDRVEDIEEKYKQRNQVSKVDCWKECHPHDLLDDNQIIGSSRLNTRIDYIICNEELKPYLKECDIDEEGSTISDHLPVAAIFEFCKSHDNE